MDAILPDRLRVLPAFLVPVHRGVLECDGEEVGEHHRHTPEFLGPALGEDGKDIEFLGETAERGGQDVVIGVEICYHWCISSFL